MKKIILGSLVGGIIVFVWGMISWVVLPWHANSFHELKMEASVQDLLVASAPQKGVYLLPYTYSSDTEKSKRAMAQMETGPFAFIVMSPTGLSHMSVSMIRSLAIQIASAFVLTLLLLLANIPSYLNRVLFSLLFALGAGMLCYLPEWNWWGFPSGYIVLSIFDLVIGWFLAGLVLAKITAIPIENS